MKLFVDEDQGEAKSEDNQFSAAKFILNDKEIVTSNQKIDARENMLVLRLNQKLGDDKYEVKEIVM